MGPASLPQDVEEFGKYPSGPLTGYTRRLMSRKQNEDGSDTLCSSPPSSLWNYCSAVTVLCTYYVNLFIYLL